MRPRWKIRACWKSSDKDRRYTDTMDFQYDPSKAASNLRKHGVSFSEAKGVFADPLAIYKEDPDAVGEFRFIAIGIGGNYRLLVVVYTLRDDVIRIISARRAKRYEVRAYEG